MCLPLFCLCFTPWHANDLAHANQLYCARDKSFVKSIEIEGLACLHSSWQVMREKMLWVGGVLWGPTRVSPTETTKTINEPLRTNVIYFGKALGYNAEAAGAWFPGEWRQIPTPPNVAFTLEPCCGHGYCQHKIYTRSQNVDAPVGHQETLACGKPLPA